MSNIMLQKQVDEFVAAHWAYGYEGDHLAFPKAPCTWLCGRKDIKRFHFSCLTCPIRRYYLKKRGHEKLTKYKRAVLFMESVSGRGFIMPKRYKIYGLIVPLDENGKASKLKSWLLKPLLTLAERIAEW